MINNNDSMEIFDIFAISFCNDNGNVTNSVDINTIEFLFASKCELCTVHRQTNKLRLITCIIVIGYYELKN